MTRQPCPSCPWRVDQDARAIPHFSLPLAERLAETCPDEKDQGPQWGAPMFACHQSRDGEELVCAGWLASVGGAHPVVRVQVLRGEVSLEALRPGPGWPELEPDYRHVIEKLRASVEET